METGRKLEKETFNQGGYTKIVITMSGKKQQKKEDVPSCSNNCLGVSESNERSKELKVESLSTLSASCEETFNLDWAVIAKNIISTPENFTPSNVVGCIHKQFRIMYFLCLTTLKPREKEMASNRESKSSWFLSKLQLVLFWTIATLASWRSFSDAKYALLWFLFGGGLNWLVKLASSVTYLLTTLCATWVFVRKSENVLQMFKCVQKFEEKIKTDNKWHFYVPIILSIITTMLAFLRSVFVVEIHKLSVEKVTSLLSTQIAEDIFLWSPINLNVSSKLVYMEYGTEVNSVSVTLSWVKITQDFGFKLQHGVIWDLLLIVTLTLQFWMNLFVESVLKVSDGNSCVVSKDGIKLGRNRALVWKMYRDIRHAFESVNNVFEPLILCFHLSNILRYALFLERCICSQNVTVGVFFQILYDITKSEVIYMVASNMNYQNKVVRKWLRNWSLNTGKICPYNEEMDISVVLDEHTDEPLGLGKNEFVIHPYLHFKILGLAGSLFLLLANNLN